MDPRPATALSPTRQTLGDSLRALAYAGCAAVAAVLLLVAALLSIGAVIRPLWSVLHAVVRAMTGGRAPAPAIPRHVAS